MTCCLCHEQIAPAEPLAYLVHGQGGDERVELAHAVPCARVLVLVLTEPSPLFVDLQLN